jgi:arylsulfatase A
MKQLIKTSWLILLLRASLIVPVIARDHPNILLIVSDDQGYNDLELLGNGIITPNRDRLAREGIRDTAPF